ncbi:MAG: PAS domain S-box protein [Desulfobacterales bacterium]|nr:PAS domain S-box protein [Desulfobacterales bacterium]
MSGKYTRETLAKRKRMYAAVIYTVCVLFIFYVIAAGYILHRQDLKQRENRLNLLAAQLKEQTSDFFKEHMSLFAMLSEIQAVKKKQTGELNELFKRLNQRFSGFENIAAVDEKGFFFASGRPFDISDPPNVSGLGFFQKAEKSGNPFVIMDIHVGPISHEDVTGVVARLEDENHRYKGLLGTSIKLSHLTAKWTKLTEKNNVRLFAYQGYKDIFYSESFERMEISEKSKLNNFFLNSAINGIYKIDKKQYLYKKVYLDELSSYIVLVSEYHFSPVDGFVSNTLYFVITAMFALTIVILVIIHQRESAWLELLIKSEEKFRLFFENEPGYCYMISLDGTIKDINKSAIDILGYSKAEIIGKPLITTVYAPSSHEKVKDLLKKWKKKGELNNEELNIITNKGEERTVLLNALAIKDDKGEILHSVSVQRDITKRRQTEDDLKKTAEELRHSNKELERFVYVASHDLQEPLRMVSSYVQLLERRYKGKLDADADEFIGFASEGAVRIHMLINDLLAFSSVGTRGESFKPVETENILEQTLADLRITAKESSATVTHDTLPTVMGDSSLLIQVFQNLISNAIKFRGKERPRIHVTAEKKDREWQFSFRDNSIGIAPEYHDRIFIIFQRLHTRDKYPGNGMGLAICKKIVERHGGRIWVESQEGIGSVFYFTIPVG